MTCMPAISFLLAESTAVTQLLGKYGGTPTIFPNHLPESVVAYPTVVFRGGKTNTSLAMNNAAVYDQTVSILCLARSYDAVCKLANAVESALSGQAGVINGIRVSGIYPDDESETNEGLVDTGDDFQVQQKEVCLKVWFKSA